MICTLKEYLPKVVNAFNKNPKVKWLHGPSEMIDEKGNNKGEKVYLQFIKIGWQKI